MNLYRIEQLKAEALARCKKRLETPGRTELTPAAGPKFSDSLRRKHGL